MPLIPNKRDGANTGNLHRRIVKMRRNSAAVHFARVNMIKLSRTSKLGCMSWSLQAGDTCPGSFEAGTVVDACRACYAKQGNYRFRNVKSVREFNRQDWQRTDWTDDMVDALRGETHFRWFDSGDMYAIGLARKILEVMQRTPDVRHWLPTRMHKFGKFGQILNAMRALPNVAVRPSSDSVIGEFGAEHGSVIIPDAASAPPGSFVCGAYTRAGQCGTCRACWDKSVQLIAYPAHGQAAAKVIRLKLAA